MLTNRVTAEQASLVCNVLRPRVPVRAGAPGGHAGQALAAGHRFRRAGRRVGLRLVGGQQGGLGLDGIPVYNVSDQVYWRELESVQLHQAHQGWQQ